MNSLVKDYMSKHKVLIAYVRDVYGFRKGAVVAISPTNLGFSMVKKSEDSDWKRVKPYQLPAVQRMTSLVRNDNGTEVPVFTAEDIINSQAYQKCVRADHLIRVPRFDRKLALMYAIDSALANEIEVGEDGFLYADDRVPADYDLWKALELLVERAKKVVKWDIEA